MTKTKPVLAAGVLLLAIGTGWLASTRTEPVSSAPTTPARRVVAAEGTVQAMRGHEAEVGSQLTGRIARFLVNEGDWVKSGQVIAVLDNADTLARLNEARGELAAALAKQQETASGSREEEIEQAASALAAQQAELDLAKSELERFQSLRKEGIVSASMLNEKEKSYRVALARVAQAEEHKRLLEKGARRETLEVHQHLVEKARSTVALYAELLEKSSVRTPISGKVIHKNLQEGEVVYAEAPVPLIVVADVEKTWINAEVDEKEIGRIAIGHAVDVTSDAYPGKVFRGRIVEIADYVGARKIRPNEPAKNLDEQVVQVKITLQENGPFRLGMAVDVRIHPE
jgi:ABC exporter DevB family membrane fusion protein